MNYLVDKFIEDSDNWTAEIKLLRDIILKSGLSENYKWNLPCYSSTSKNIVIIQPFKSCLGLMFFKGALLKDAEKRLVDNGPNSRSAKRLEFKTVSEIKKNKTVILNYIKEAIEIEKTGKKVVPQKMEFPPELKAEFNLLPKLEKAFATLTPGRQRAYLLFFTGAKQSSTRLARIKKYSSAILKGKGLTD